MAGASPVQTQEDLVPLPPAAIGYRLGGVLLAPAVAVAVHVVLAGPLGLELTADGQPITVRETLVVSLVVSLLAWLSVAVLERGLGERGRRIWVTAAAGLYAASIIPVALMDVPMAQRWGLVALHTATALVIIPSMANATPAVPLTRDR